MPRSIMLVLVIAFLLGFALTFYVQQSKPQEKPCNHRNLVVEADTIVVRIKNGDEVELFRWNCPDCGRSTETTEFYLESRPTNEN